MNIGTAKARMALAAGVLALSVWGVPPVAAAPVGVQDWTSYIEASATFESRVWYESGGDMALEFNGCHKPGHQSIAVTMYSVRAGGPDPSHGTKNFTACFTSGKWSRGVWNLPRSTNYYFSASFLGNYLRVDTVKQISNP